MSRSQLDDALDSMSRGELEKLISAATKRLADCAVCGEAHAIRFQIRDENRRASLFLCEACYAKLRQPDRKQPEEGPSSD
jgi:predicted SprT family Zn-dependent metalloprotease